MSVKSVLVAVMAVAGLIWAGVNGLAEKAGAAVDNAVTFVAGASDEYARPTPVGIRETETPTRRSMPRELSDNELLARADDALGHAAKATAESAGNVAVLVSERGVLATQLNRLDEQMSRERPALARGIELLESDRAEFRLNGQTFNRKRLVRDVTARSKRLDRVASLRNRLLDQINRFDTKIDEARFKVEGNEAAVHERKWLLDELGLDLQDARSDQKLAQIISAIADFPVVGEDTAGHVFRELRHRIARLRAESAVSTSTAEKGHLDLSDSSKTAENAVSMGRAALEKSGVANRQAVGLASRGGLEVNQRKPAAMKMLSDETAGSTGR